MAAEGIPYFCLDCHTNENMAELEAEFGVKGFAIVVRLWQKIYAEKGYYCEWTERSPLLFLAQWFGGNSGVDLNLITSVVNRAISIGIFDAEMYKNFSILTSLRIQEHYFHVTKRRSKVNIKSEYLLASCAQNEKVASKNDKNVNKNEKNVSKKEHSIVKESKEKARKDVLPEQASGSEEAKPPHRTKPETENQFSVPVLPTRDGKDYQASQEDLDEWHSLYPDIDIAWEFKKMRGWIGGKPERKKTYRGMKRFINSWLATAQQDFLDKKISNDAKRRARPNAFSNFSQRDYDDENLERLLMSADGSR